MSDRLLFENLKTRAEYAVKSYNRDLVFEIYGMAKSLRWLERITHEEFMELNDMLIKNCINNGRWANRADQ